MSESKTAGPTSNFAPFVVEVHRHPEMYGFHTFTSTNATGAIWLALEDTFRCRIDTCDPEEAKSRRRFLESRDYVWLDWDDVWPDMQDYIIRRVLPIEWQEPVRNGDEEYISDITVWTLTEKTETKSKSLGQVYADVAKAIVESKDYV